MKLITNEPLSNHQNKPQVDYGDYLIRQSMFTGVVNSILYE